MLTIRVIIYQITRTPANQQLFGVDGPGLFVISSPLNPWIRVPVRQQRSQPDPTPLEGFRSRTSTWLGRRPRRRHFIAPHIHMYYYHHDDSYRQKKYIPLSLVDYLLHGLLVYARYVVVALEPLITGYTYTTYRPCAMNFLLRSHGY